MSYSKKNRYPSIKTPGVYRDATDKQLGLDVDDLENFSLGNWNTTFRGNKLLLSGNLLSTIKERTGVPVKIRTSPPKRGDRVLVWRFRRNIRSVGGYVDPGNNIYENRIALAQGPIFETLSDEEELTGDTRNDHEAVKNARLERTKAVYERFYGSENVVRSDNKVIIVNNSALFDDNSYLSFNRGSTGILKQREEDDPDIRLVFDQGSKGHRNFHVFEREISSEERDMWGGGDYVGRDTAFNRELVVVVNWDIQAFNIPMTTMDELASVSWNFNPGPNGSVLGLDSFPSYPSNSADAITLRGFGESEGNRHRHSGPNEINGRIPFKSDSAGASYRTDYFQDEPHFGGYGYYNVISTNHGGETAGFNVGAIEFDLADDWQIDWYFAGNVRFSNDLTFSAKGDRDTLDEAQVRALDIHFNFLNYPTFELDVAIDDPEYIKSLQSFNTPVDFVVFAETDTGTELLYYDFEDDFEDYMETSYPVNVKLNVGLLNHPTHLNNTHAFDIDAVIAAFGGGGLAARDFLNDSSEGGINLPNYANNPDLCYYKYQVIQWGDEKQLLTDEQIENSYFFNFYDGDEYPSSEDFFYRKYQQSQIVESTPIDSILEHSYNTPGIKTIKIIVYRYHPNSVFILQTYLVTKNIVVGDGVLKSEDFSIFGTSDFNFLPLTDNQVIIGGFDEDSKYNNSIEQMVKDDLFGKDEFLDRVSSREFINNFNNQLLGENISQMDVGNTRMFNKPRDIYDFIGGNRLQWISQGSGSLPLNSLATDIFIDEGDCILDLNPSESEYLSIENNFGKAKGILIGDYKLIKTKGAPVVKQGAMESPKIDKDENRQAF